MTGGARRAGADPGASPTSAGTRTSASTGAGRHPTEVGGVAHQAPQPEEAAVQAAAVEEAAAEAAAAGGPASGVAEADAAGAAEPGDGTGVEANGAAAEAVEAGEAGAATTDPAEAGAAESGGATVEDGGPGDEALADSVADLERLRQERDEFLDALRRLQADFENYRKRVQRQQDESVARAAEQLVAALLPALDAFELAAEHLVGDEQVSPGGLLQAAALLRDILAKEGVDRIGEAGDPFDPTAHEAVEHVADDGGDGPVVEAVLRAGYRYRGRTIRPAMVKVRG